MASLPSAPPVHETAAQPASGAADGRVAIERPIRVPRAYEQVVAVLRQRISSGALNEGDRLPSETALAQQAGVGRSTVREALRTLQAAGLIERASPKVMVVRRQTDDFAFAELTHALRRRRVTFRHVHEALLAIEPVLARLAAERADAADLRALRKNLEAQHRAIEDFAEWGRLDQDFHLIIAEISANPALVIARAPITQLLLPSLQSSISSATQTTHGTRYHERIFAEIEAHDPALAEAVMRRHIDDWRTAWIGAGLDEELEIADAGDTSTL
jgi:GntR family transcriptional repressor for pyruvate dehydrogenase complex